MARTPTTKTPTRKPPTKPTKVPPPPKKRSPGKVRKAGGVEPFALPGIDVRLYRRTGPRGTQVPSIDEGYQFRPELVEELAWSAWPADGGSPFNVALVGPKGSGKTSLVEQVAARANIPVYRVNLNVGTTVRHLFGRIAVRDGATVFVPGVVTKAMEEGAWLLLDELSGATPPVSLALFPVFEPDGAVWLSDDDPPRYINRHPNFRLFCTDNTIGAANEDSRFNYQGTNLMNAALVDRIGTTLQVDYLDPAAEKAALLSRVKLPTDAKWARLADMNIDGLIRVANKIRASEDIGGGFSHRMLLDWSRRVVTPRMDARGKPKKTTGSTTEIIAAANSSFLAKMPSRSDSDAILGVIQRIFAGTE